MIQRFISFQIYFKLLLFLAFGFVIFTIIGTLTHEMGHIVFAKAQGYQTTLHYGSMNYSYGSSIDEFNAIWDTYEREIKNGEPYPKEERRQELLLEMQRKRNWITAGGPLQTIITGTVGFILLYRRKESIATAGMKILDWFYMFLTFFWLRELANPITGLISSFMEGEIRLFEGGDEFRLAQSLGCWKGSFSLPLAVIAFGIFSFVVFRIIPKNLRSTLLAAGLIGGIFGYFFWLEWVGPILIP